MSQPLMKEREVFFTLPEKHVPERRAMRRKSFNLSRSKLPTLMMVLLLVYLALSFSSQFGRLSIMQKDVRNIEQQVQELKQKNSAMREELQLVQTDAYIEKTAREKLGLVKPGETRVVPVPSGTELKKIQAPVQSGVVSD